MNMSIADELLKLKNLLDAGVINQAEFDKQKSKLIHGEEKESFATPVAKKFVEPKKKVNWKVVGFAFFLFIIFMASLKDDKEKNTPKTPEEAAAEFQRAREDTLKNAYYTSKNYLKDNLNDRDSFEEISHVEQFIEKTKKKQKAYVIVAIKYRAKNAFGGYVSSRQVFTFDKTMQMIGTEKFE